MSIKTVITYQCDAPGCKNTFVYDKPGATRRVVRAAASKDGWTRKGSKIQFCPKHAPAKSNGKVAKPTAKKVVKGKSRKGTLDKKVTKTGVWEFGKQAEETSSPASE